MLTFQVEILDQIFLINLARNKMSKEQDPLDPESEIFWEGPEAIRQNLQKSSVSTEPDKPYSLKPQAAGPGPSISRDVINTNTTLKRPAGN